MIEITLEKTVKTVVLDLFTCTIITDTTLQRRLPYRGQRCEEDSRHYHQRASVDQPELHPKVYQLLWLRATLEKGFPGSGIILVYEVMSVLMRQQNQLSVHPYQLSSALLVTSITICMASHYQTLWQADWDGCVSNKLHTIKPLLGHSDVTNLNRRNSVVLRTLHISRTQLTHSYLLNGQDQPQCNLCCCALTLLHILLECRYYDYIRQIHFSAATLKVLKSYSILSMYIIFLALKYISLYHSI